MKIELTTGCTLDSLTINDVPYEKLNINQIKSKLIELIEKFEDKELYDDLIRNIVNSQGEFTHGYTCDQCGDFVETYVLEC